MKNFVFHMIALLLFYINLQGQTRDPFIPGNSLRLNIVFPMDGDTLNFKEIRYAGSVLRGGKVWVQNKRTKVYSSGAFVGMVDLQPGLNAITFKAKDRFGTLTDRLFVYRESFLPTRPTAFDSSKVEPMSDVFISPGDFLEVQFFGSPDGRADFSIPGVANSIKMREVSPRVAGGFRGLYKGKFKMPLVQDDAPKTVEFRLKGKDRKEITFQAKGKIHLMSSDWPYLGVTVDSINTCFKKPGSQVLMELPPGIKMQIVGLWNEFKKIRLSEDEFCYIPSESVQHLPFDVLYPFSTMNDIDLLDEEGWLQLQVDLTNKVPFRILQKLHPSSIEVIFYHCKIDSEFIALTQNDILNQTLLYQEGEKTILRIALKQEQQWGYSGRYVGNQFWFNIRKPPKISTDQEVPLKGLTLVVDAGHGGEFEGATGATGLQEKRVNLKLAKKVRNLLLSEGALVIMTHNKDTTMTLLQRATLAQKAQAHIFVSLHNNSIAPGTNPLQPRGTSTFYTQLHSKEIANLVYEKLFGTGLKRFGSKRRPFFLTRQTNFLSFIVEGAFLTHPEDEILLLDDNFLDKMAEAIAAGIKVFVLKQRSN